MSRQSELIVNIGAIINNYREIQKLQPDKKIIPILKAAGYGIGMDAVESILKELDIDIIGTAIVDEGIELREKIKYDKEILVINQPSIEEIDNIIKYDITVGCCYLEFLKQLDIAAKIAQKKIKVHIEIETGMGRTGVQEYELPKFIEDVCKLDNIIVEGIYTHFATSDIDIEFTQKQIEIFNRAVEYIKSKLSTIKCVHCGNSGAILQIHNLPGNMMRPGIALYGYYPSETVEKTIKLEPCCILKSKVSYIKEVESNTSISYGRTFITSRKSKIANVPIGYADGISRKLSNRGKVLINGNLVPIVGVVCMDSFMIDVTDIPNVEIGSDIYIWDNENITVEEIARECDTINYEILTSISNRVKRVIK